MPCNSGSKGGCWAPYTCWMLFKKEKGDRLASLPPPREPTTDSGKGPVPSDPHTSLRAATLHQLPRVPRARPGGMNAATQARTHKQRAFSPPCKWPRPGAPGSTGDEATEGWGLLPKLRQPLLSGRVPPAGLSPDDHMPIWKFSPGTTLSKDKTQNYKEKINVVL